MINLNNYEIFNSCKSSLKETSKNDAKNKGKETKYMINSSFKVIDFDKVKLEYTKNMKLPETPKSNDALFNFKNF
ncbi:MAG: hypothetical protein RSE93_06955, partial [Oscillospiraceae bacterium]